MSVYAFLAEKPDQKYLDPLAYRWKRVWGSEQMRQITSGKNVVQDVKFPPSWQDARWSISSDWPDDNPDGGFDGPYYFGYASSFDHLVDGVMFDDGTLLICAGIDTFVGTDCDNAVQNNFYFLTPL